MIAAIYGIGNKKSRKLMIGELLFLEYNDLTISQDTEKRADIDRAQTVGSGNAHILPNFTPAKRDEKRQIWSSTFAFWAYKNTNFIRYRARAERGFRLAPD